MIFYIFLVVSKKVLSLPVHSAKSARHIAQITTRTTTSINVEHYKYPLEYALSVDFTRRIFEAVVGLSSVWLRFALSFYLKVSAALLKKVEPSINPYNQKKNETSNYCY